MRFEAPWFLLLLLLVPLVVWHARRTNARRPSLLWGRVASSWRGGAGWMLHALELLPWAALVVAVMALARPQQGVRQSETETRGVDIVLAIDISPSMMAEDFQPENRLAVAKQTARTFISQRPHDRIGLVGFAATAFNQCPLTLDHDALLELLDGLDFGLAEDGTAIGMGLATSVAGLRTSKTPSKVVVLLTDGQNNRGAIDPLTGADLARAYGVKVYTVLVGRGGVVPVPVDDPLLGRRTQMVRMDVDEATLREIARRTGGRYYRATGSASLSSIYSQIDRLERAPIRSITYREYVDLGPTLLGLAGLMLMFYLFNRTTWGLSTP
ncbi:MAG TPA: VWA domain-containing protein [Dongiaceae bacterium]|nr:VWA domain-containing protein [Dongiaceae bacterium]